MASQTNTNRALKKLANHMGIAVGYLKKLNDNAPTTRENIMANNTANACRAIAAWVGYEDEATIKKIVSWQINLLFTDGKELIPRLKKYKEQSNEHYQAIIQQAIDALEAEDYRTLIALARSNPCLGYLARSRFVDTPDEKLIEQFRQLPKTNAVAAKVFLAKLGLQNRIFCPSAAINACVEKRVKHLGNIGALFWLSGKTLNAKLRNSKEHKVPKFRKQIKGDSKGKKSVQSRTNEIRVATFHPAEKYNKKFAQKLEKLTKQQEKFWADKAADQIAAAQWLNKLLEV